MNKGCSILSKEMGIRRSGWTYLLLPLFLLFVIGGAVEIVHPLEEARHPPHAHHEHSEPKIWGPNGDQIFDSECANGNG